MNKTFSFQNKLVLVTGAGSGIGRALALALIQKDANVIAVDIHKESLDGLKTSLSKKDVLSTYVLDITDRNAVEALQKKIATEHGQIDVLINNAGIIQPFVKVNDLDYDSIERVMNVNFYGVLYMTKAFLPSLLERPEAYIANVSSMGGFLPVPGQSVYGASKAAVKLMTEGLYAEMMDTNINVSIIFPGATQTNIAENSGIKSLPKASNKKYSMTSSEEAAQVIIKGMEKKKLQVFIGKDSKSMNLLYRISPSYAVKLIEKKMRDLLPKA